jgi:hypothetical protein
MFATGVPVNDFFSLGVPLLIGGYSIKETGGILKETFWDSSNNIAALKTQIANINDNIIRLLTKISSIHNTIKANPTLKPLTIILENFLNEQQKLIDQILQITENSEKADKDKSKEIYKLIMESLIKKSKQDTTNDSFNLALKAVGQIDCYLSLAKLIKEEKYCFVDFVEDKNINIAFEDLTDPTNQTQQTFSTKIDTVTTNLATQEKLVAVTNAIILSHLGIAPAKKVTISPISYLHTSLPQNMFVINN